MMQKFINPLTSEWKTLIDRPTASYDDLEDLVLEVFEQVQKRGDEAVFEYTKQFDKIQLQTLQVSPEEILNGVNAVPKELKKQSK
jgi:histidinol dehydrogenase